MISVLLAALGTLPQESQGPNRGSSDRAVRQGLAWLRTAEVPPESRELVLLALTLHDFRDRDPRVPMLLGEALEMPLEDTARVAFLAMVLDQFDRLRYQPVLASLAQFLVDTQAGDGLWPKASPAVALEVVEVPPSPPPKKRHPRSFGAPVKPFRNVLSIRIDRKLEGPLRGDRRSGSLAVEGLLACVRSGIEIPKETLARAEKAWREAQDPDGGWRAGPDAPASVLMSAAGTACLRVSGFLSDPKAKWEPGLDRAAAWLERNHDVSAGPELAEALWWLDRAGMMLDREAFGSWAWFPALSRTLVEAQKPDGAWDLGGAPVRDSAFALLVLRPPPSLQYYLEMMK